MLIYCKSLSTDDISDLLKFYKKLPAFNADELPVASNDSLSMADVPDVTTAFSVGSSSSSTPSNMGYIRTWGNMQNFTLMITLRAKVRCHVGIY